MTDDDKMTTIRVSKVNRARLNKIAGHIKGNSGVNISVNTVINYLFSFLPDSERKELEAKK